MKFKRKELHRQLEDIPSVSCDDPELYPSVIIFNHDRIQIKRAIAFEKKHVHSLSPTKNVIHNDGKHLHVVRVSKTQAKCYNVVKDRMPLVLHQSVLESIYMESTVKALIKRGLLAKDTGGEIKIATNT